MGDSSLVPRRHCFYPTLTPGGDLWLSLSSEKTDWPGTVTDVSIGVMTIVEAKHRELIATSSARAAETELKRVQVAHAVSQLVATLLKGCELYAGLVYIVYAECDTLHFFLLCTPAYMYSALASSGRIVV